MLGGPPPGEAGPGKVAAAPEEVHRAALADEAAAEGREDPVRLHQHTPEAIGVFGIVRRVLPVRVERDRVLELVRRRVNLHLQTQLPQRREELWVEIRYRAWPQRDRPHGALATLDQEPVVDEVEVDLKRPRAVPE